MYSELPKNKYVTANKINRTLVKPDLTQKNICQSYIVLKEPERTFLFNKINYTLVKPDLMQKIFANPTLF